MSSRVSSYNENVNGFDRIVRDITKEFEEVKMMARISATIAIVWRVVDFSPLTAKTMAMIEHGRPMNGTQQQTALMIARIRPVSALLSSFVGAGGAA